jgi:hypothetical protein
MKRKTYLPINWTDGVKLTKDHFINNYFNFIATINEYNNVNLNDFNYGIIDDTFELLAETEGSKSLKATLKKGNIIAKNGHLIQFSPEIYGKDYPVATLNETELDQNSTDTFYIIVSINPNKLIPVGIPDPEMVPLHHPNVAPEIKLQILNKNEVNHNFLEGYFLILKKYNFQNGSFVDDENYIAPVTKLKNNKLLLNFSTFFNKELHAIYDFSISIHKKNIQNSANNKLVLNTFSLCKNIIQFYTENNFYLNNIAKEEPPVFMIEKIVILSNNLMSTLTIMDEKEKEVLLQYYYEWIDVKPSELLNVLLHAKDVVYNHNDIYQSLEKMNQLIEVLKKLWKKLSELEYIGIRKENIVISEETKTAPPKVKTWSILD